MGGSGSDVTVASSTTVGVVVSVAMDVSDDAGASSAEAGASGSIKTEQTRSAAASN
ncbi:MAG: hypothetical protein WC169_02500 [Dehalococcoidia bacterium]